MKTSGYIVLDTAGPLALSRFEDGPFVLVTDNATAHLFRDYAAARAAISRTRRYAARKGLGWPSDYEIVRLTEVPVT